MIWHHIVVHARTHVQTRTLYYCTAVGVIIGVLSISISVLQRGKKIAAAS